MNKWSEQARGLIGWWPTPGGGGNILYDKSGFGNHGTLTGGISRVADGKFGQVLALDGINGWVSVPDSPILEPKTGITMAIWAKRDNPIVRDMLMGKADAILYSNSPYWMEFWDGPTGEPDDIHLSFVLSESQLVKIHKYDGSGPAVTDTDWHHIAITWDNNTVRAYVDGKQHTTTWPWANHTLASDNNPFGIGRLNWATSVFGGLLADARLYNWGLPSSLVREIVNPSTRWELYEPTRPRVWPAVKLEETPVVAPVFQLPKLKTSKPPSESFKLNKQSEQAEGLIRWFPFLGSAGNYIREYVRDESLNQITGASWIIDTKMGRGLRFVNTNDHKVDFTQIILLPPWSIAAWAKPTGTTGFRVIVGKNDFGLGSCYLNVTSTVFQFRANATAQNVVGATPTPSTGLNLYVVTLDTAGNGKGYINGINQGNKTGVTQTEFHLGRIGRYASQTDWTFDGDIFSVGFYNHVLSAAEARDYYSNPWELYEPIRPIFFGYSTEEDIEEVIFSWHKVYKAAVQNIPIHQLRI